MSIDTIPLSRSNQFELLKIAENFDFFSIILRFQRLHSMFLAAEFAE